MRDNQNIAVTVSLVTGLHVPTSKMHNLTADVLKDVQAIIAEKAKLAAEFTSDTAYPNPTLDGYKVKILELTSRVIQQILK